MLKRILRNFSWLSIAVAVEIALGVIVMAILARRLGPTHFGEYSLWLAFIVLFTPLYDFGLGPLSLRQIARSQTSVLDYLKVVWKTKIVLSAVGFAVILGIARILGYIETAAMGWAFLFLAISQIVRTASMLNRAVFRAYEKMHIQTYVETASSLGRLLLVGGVVIIAPNLVLVCLAMAASNLGEFLASTAIIRGMVLSQETGDGGQKQSVGAVLRAAVPFASYDLFNGMYMRADTVLLGTFSGVQPVAWYTAAYKIGTLISLGPRTLMDGIYPILCKESREKVRELVHRLLVLVLLGIFPVILILTVFSPELIRLVYGVQYAPAVQAFRILIWGIFFVSGSAVLLNALNALHQEKTVAKIMAFIAFLGFTAYFLCIPRWGYIGASVISASIELGGFILMFIAASRKMGGFLVPWRVGCRMILVFGFALAAMWFMTQHISRGISLVAVLFFYAAFALYETHRATSLFTVLRAAGLRSHLFTRDSVPK